MLPPAGPIVERASSKLSDEAQNVDKGDLKLGIMMPDQVQEYRTKVVDQMLEMLENLIQVTAASITPNNQTVDDKPD